MLHQKNRGFTLVELLVMIAILSVIAIIILVMVDPAKRIAQSQDAQRLIDVDSVHKAVNAYALDYKVPQCANLGTEIPADNTWRWIGSGSNVVVTKIMEGCPSYDEEGTGKFAGYRCKLNKSASVDHPDYIAAQQYPESEFCCGSLADWDDALGGIDFGGCTAGNLVCAGKIAVAEISGTWENPDPRGASINGGPTMDGWNTPGNTDAEHYVKIYTTGIARHNGVWSDTAYRFIGQSEASSFIIYLNAPYVKIEGLQLRTPPDNLDTAIKSYVYSNNVEISECIFRGPAYPVGTYYGIYQTCCTNVDNMVIKNNIFYDYFNKTGRAISITYVNNSLVSNNTFYSCGTGIIGKDYETRIYNNLHSIGTNGLFYSSSSGKNAFKEAYNNVISGTDNFSFFVSSDNNRQSVGPINFVGEYANPRDLHLATTDTSSKDRGYAFSELFLKDIDGDERDDSWDIGADEVGNNSDWGLVSEYSCDLEEDLVNGGYLSKLPEDPTEGDLAGLGNTGYMIKRSLLGEVWVWAPSKSDYFSQDKEIFKTE